MSEDAFSEIGLQGSKGGFVGFEQHSPRGKHLRLSDTFNFGGIYPDTGR